MSAVQPPLRVFNDTLEIAKEKFLLAVGSGIALAVISVTQAASAQDVCPYGYYYSYAYGCFPASPGYGYIYGDPDYDYGYGPPVYDSFGLTFGYEEGRGGRSRGGGHRSVGGHNSAGHSAGV
jgi:hypothetical protein